MAQSKEYARQRYLKDREKLLQYNRDRRAAIRDGKVTPGGSRNRNKSRALTIDKLREQLDAVKRELGLHLIGPRKRELDSEADRLKRLRKECEQIISKVDIRLSKLTNEQSKEDSPRGC